MVILSVASYTIEQIDHMTKMFCSYACCGCSQVDSRCADVMLWKWITFTLHYIYLFRWHFNPKRLAFNILSWEPTISIVYKAVFSILKIFQLYKQSSIIWKYECVYIGGVCCCFCCWKVSLLDSFYLDCGSLSTFTCQKMVPSCH